MSSVYTRDSLFNNKEDFVKKNIKHGAEHATCHLEKWWPDLLTHICVTLPWWVKATAIVVHIPLIYEINFILYQFDNYSKHNYFVFSERTLFLSAPGPQMLN